VLIEPRLGPPEAFLGEAQTAGDNQRGEQRAEQRVIEPVPKEKQIHS
jgi:hypothetical protein